MIRGKKHLTQDKRYVIQDMLYDCKSAKSIAKYLKVSSSTITREVKNNRTIKIPKRTYKLPARKCKFRDKCDYRRILCEHCVSPNSFCKECKKRDCTSLCGEFVHVTCPITDKWPYVCNPLCDNRSQCIFPKCSYKAEDADNAYRSRLIETRQGINMTEEEYKNMCDTVNKLLDQGQSPRVIWKNNPDEFPVGWRCYYAYAHDEKMEEVYPMKFPRMKRYKPRNNNKKKSGKSRKKIDRTGHEYSDFQNLTLEEITRAVEVDTVVGRRGIDHQSILTMHFSALAFQIHILLAEHKKEYVKKAFDVIEIYLGSIKEFKRIFGIILLDRGLEFDGFRELEMSCLEPGKKRCKIFFCDPCASHQKSHCENNHAEIRKIFPKKYTNFDKLTFNDVAIMSSHVNSYLRPTTGQIPLLLARMIIPNILLENLGIELIGPNDVILKPSLLPHTQIPIN